MDYRLQMELLGGQQGEALAEVKFHLIAEDGACAGAGAVRAVGSVGEYPVEELEILFHDKEWVRRDGREVRSRQLWKSRGWSAPSSGWRAACGWPHS